ncbi:acyl carrier protein [Enterobacter adelaidei]
MSNFDDAFFSFLAQNVPDLSPDDKAHRTFTAAHFLQDSLDVLTVLGEIEKHYGVRVPDDYLAEMQTMTLQELCDLVKKEAS